MSYDFQGLFEFLTNTPEKGLRKMLVDPKQLTDVHFQLLIKIVRHENAVSFSEHFDKKTFPKIKLSPAEQKLKEKFWTDCETVLKARGLLAPATPQKAAA